MAALHKVGPYAVMNPAIWGSLPRELLVLVLARLPVPEITRLRCQLSKEWIMNTELNGACDDWNPNMAALVSYAGRANAFSVRIIDFKKFIWLYEYRFLLTNRGNAPSGAYSFGMGHVWMPMASDGGLICFVSTWNYTEENPLCIVVINPLTRVQHEGVELPRLQHLYTVLPTLVHMKVDLKTKAYKVVVIVKKTGCDTIETYDSVSRQWSTSTPSWGRILGRACAWIWKHNKFWSRPRICAYDLEEGQLEFLDGDSLFQVEGAHVRQYALAGDRMVVLHRKLDEHANGGGFFFITEFQSQDGVKVWVPVRTHDKCFPEDEYCFLNLIACEDVLMFRKHNYLTNCILHFLNFSTNEWHKFLEHLPIRKQVRLMCRVFWHVIPWESYEATQRVGLAIVNQYARVLS